MQQNTFLLFSTNQQMPVICLSSVTQSAGDTVREESLVVLPLKRTMREEDLFKSFIEFAKEKNLQMEKNLFLYAPMMNGLVALLCEQENRPIRSFHCNLHQEALCAQVRDNQLHEVMLVVIRVVNFMVARALGDRYFKALLDKVEVNYPGLVMHSIVCWL